MKKVTNKNIQREIVKIIKRLDPSLENTEISTDQNLTDFFDSLDAVECLMELEKVFDIVIYDEDAEKMLTIKDCCKILSEKYLISPYDRIKKLKKINNL